MAATESSSQDGAANCLPMLQKVGVDAWLRAHGKVVRPELTKKQKQELKECFDLIDADGSGAIDAEELVTAFNVLGMRVKKSEVEKMLAEVDADGSGEVEYPEFVQIMTSKLDSQTQEGDVEEKSKKQPLPFQLLAQAYRRKKLMEAVMGGDKTAQERLRAKAEEAEAERKAVLVAMEAEKQNPVLRYDEKKVRTISDVKYRRMKRDQAQKKLERGQTLPEYVVEHLDDELKQVILESCQDMAISKESAAASNYLLSTTEESKSFPACIVKQSFGQERIQEMSRMSFYNLNHSFHKQELAKLGQHRNRVRHKPVLEQQLLHLRAVKSIQDYLQNQAHIMSSTQECNTCH